VSEDMRDYFGVTRGWRSRAHRAWRGA